MNTPFKHLPVVYLHPGEVYFGDKPVVVSTVLGSCVSITVFSKKFNYGGISHCMLPYCESKDDCKQCDDAYRYVYCTLDTMVQKFERMNLKRDELEIKAFGAADVLITKEERLRSKTIGKQNIRALENWMNKNKIKLTSYDVGGEKGRKLFFLPASGDVYIKKIVNEKD